MRLVSTRAHDAIEAIGEQDGRRYHATLRRMPPTLNGPFDLATPWEAFPVVVENFYQKQTVVPVVSAEPVVFERPRFIDVRGEQVRVALCDDCGRRAATLYYDPDEPWGVPTSCDRCHFACHECCGWYRHMQWEAIEAEAERLGWET